MALILLDYDGVLVDSVAAESKYFTAACEKVGIEGIHTGEDLARLCEGNFYEECDKIGIDRDLIDQAFALYEKKLDDENYPIEAFPEAMEFIKETVARFPVYIITSNFSATVAEMMERWHIEGIRDILGAEKEASKVRKFNSVKALFPGEKTYFICDTKGDILEARESDIDVIIGVTWGCHMPEVLASAEPDYLFYKFEELRTFFHEL